MNYQCQYLETDFQFMQRLAKQYNEWFYYDGEKLHFGKPKELGESITLVYNKDLSKLNIAIQAVPNKFSGFTYNEETDKNHLAQIPRRHPPPGFRQHPPPPSCKETRLRPATRADR